MLDFIIETILDTLKSIPILFVVYLLIEVIQKKLNSKKILKHRNNILGPPVGALVGCIPQCGFSVASATLYNSGVIGAGTLIAVFVSTSDEAIPIMLSHSSSLELIFALIGCKVAIAIVAGYLFKFIIFRNETVVVSSNHVNLNVCDQKCHSHHSKSILHNAIIHTLKTSVFIGVTLLIINCIVFLIGENNLETLLLSNSVFQPLLTGFIGLVPGCATSVLIVELLLNNSISFGAAVAGLCSGAGFGFIVLFKGNRNIKNCIKIVACVYASGAIFGSLIQLIMGN